jgi:hypothetical protein
MIMRGVTELKTKINVHYKQFVPTRKHRVLPSERKWSLFVVRITRNTNMKGVRKRRVCNFKAGEIYYFLHRVL